MLLLDTTGDEALEVKVDGKYDNTKPNVTRPKLFVFRDTHIHMHSLCGALYQH